MSADSRSDQQLFLSTSSGICTSCGMLNAVLLLAILVGIGQAGNTIAGPLFLFLCSKGLCEWLFWKRAAYLVPSWKGLWAMPSWAWRNLAICCVLILGELTCEIYLVYLCIQSGLLPACGFLYLSGCMVASAWIVGTLIEYLRRKVALITMFMGCAIVTSLAFYNFESPVISPLVLLCCKGLLVHLALIARAAIASTFQWARAGAQS
jgi:hypothetical protein